MMENPNMKMYAEIARNRCDGDAQPHLRQQRQGTRTSENNYWLAVCRLRLTDSNVCRPIYWYATSNQPAAYAAF